MTSLRARSASAFAVTATAVLVAMAAPPAYAGPDDGKVVLTEGNVAAPKAYWENNNFVLMGEQGDKVSQIDDSVMWVSGSADKASNSTYEVGSTKGDDFLGDKGTLLYSAPSVAPNSAGVDIPTDQLRDGSFTLDIVDFHGPGRMEVWRPNPGDAGITRLWSSHEPGLRSAWAGADEQARTTFTKPGRYEVTYQATARDTEGNLVASEPQTMSWQVGGTSPSKDGIGDVAEAFNASNMGEGLENPNFTVAPHSGNDKLADLTFDSGDSANNGTAVFYIDGFHLAEVPLKDGKAQWTEMIGSKSSNFQVVYVPGSTGARWYSQPVAFERTKKAASTVELGEFPEPHSQDEPPAFEWEEYDVADASVKISGKAHGDVVDVTAEPSDERLSVHVQGRILGKGGKACGEFAFTSAPGARTQKVKLDGKCSGAQIEASAVPSARSTAGGGNGKGSLAGFDLALESGTAHTSAPSKGEGSAQSNAAKPSQSGKTNEGSTTTASDKVEISQGHIDLGPVDENGKLAFRLGDDSQQHSQSKVYRDPDDVVMRVGNEFATKVPKISGLDFLGEPGDKIYMLNQTQQGNSLWPGFSTEHAGGKAFDIEIEPDSAPSGGQWAAWTSSSFGGVGEMLASSDGSSTIERSKQIHLHNNWAFTKPGTYTMKMRAVEHGNPSNATEWETVTFSVGGGSGSGSESASGPTKQKGTKPGTTDAANSGSNKTTGTAPTTTNKSKDSTGAPAKTADSSKVELSEGHIDLGPVDRSGKTEFMLGDESFQHAKEKVYRNPNDVTMVVGDQFEHRLTEDQVSGGLDFLGKADDVVHMVQEVQQGNSLWPGFSTEHAGGKAWDIEISPDSAPDGARWFAFTGNGFGGVSEYLASSDGASTIVREKPVHLHNNWVFTKPGEYRIKMRGLEHGNPSNATEWRTVTFRVEGDGDGQGSGAAGAAKGAPAAPAAGGAAAGAAKGGAKADGAGAKSGGAQSAGAAQSGKSSGGSGAGGAKAAGASQGGKGAANAAAAKDDKAKKPAAAAKQQGKTPKSTATKAQGTGSAERTWQDIALTALSALISVVGVGLSGFTLYQRFFL
ncbi:choice-of-anchor M domain-containing protein [Corynebacterium tapiri]|uniref:Cell surface protein n=1 Tax=Corynebacterium tapiri TaxID=1448266 RepID=A0A5C4U3G2_9CORY|nr:choice-of-anchor M domain-containing protein [Corynebacterium tapiri]TNL95708.1 hypothetical protein FHE74_08920 [Corynebacterium tapiri]